jgi:hypothetical protein
MYYKSIIYVFLLTIATLQGAPEILKQEARKTSEGIDNHISYKGGWNRISSKVIIGDHEATIVYDYSSEGKLSRMGITFPKEAPAMNQMVMNKTMEEFFFKLTKIKYNPADFFFQPLQDKMTYIPAFVWSKDLRSGYVVLPFGSRSIWCTTQEADEASKNELIPPPEVP